MSYGDGEVGDLIRRHTDDAIGLIIEAPEEANFVRIEIGTRDGWGVYVTTVKEYDVVVLCACCGGGGYVRKYVE